MTKLLLIDGNSIICRYFYGLPEKKTPDGLNVNGVFGFARFLSKLLVTEVEKHHLSIVVAFDKASDNFRKEISNTYKKNRNPFPENFFHQMRLCEEICLHFNIPTDYHSNYEADDLIASYCEFYKTKYKSIIVYSNDKDLLQLVNENTYVYNVAKKTLFDMEEVEKIIGITPQQIPEFLAIAGDASDNISGIPGIGPKTAIKLLKQEGSLEAIINSLHNLKKDFTPARDFLKLTELYKNSPIKNMELTYYQLPDDQILHALERFGFLELKHIFRKYLYNEEDQEEDLLFSMS